MTDKRGLSLDERQETHARESQGTLLLQITFICELTPSETNPKLLSFMKQLYTLPTTVLLAGASAFGSSVFSGGHGDIGVGLEDGAELHLHAHLHSGAIVDGSPLTEDGEFHGDDLVINVPASTAMSVGTSLPAAGVSAGQTLWILPQNNPGDNSIPFLGLGTEELTPADWSTNITFTLDSVIPPSASGTFSLWQSDGLGGLEFYFSSADAAFTENGDNTLLLPAGAHDHANWGFSEPGEWQIQLTASGTHNSLGSLSDTSSFTFNVIPEPSSAPLILGCVIALFGHRSRRQA